ncbi:MAG TPA: RluA family pseudouridine synthase [Saprospiraceae bacterium]|nr:RluA family pseudouridine synthase [Saprospiraceae bacterium]
MKEIAEIIFQNETILAVYKPPGLLSVPDRYEDDRPSVSQWLLPKHPTARPLHRIDFETSGVLLFCLDPDAFGWYSDQFENRIITKLYLAIVEGRCQQDEGLIDQPLFTQSNGKVIISHRGKPSQTQWKVQERFKNNTALEINPLTGRTHQIRVHLSSIGHPIVGDEVYGSAGPLFLSVLKGRKRFNLSKDAEMENPLMARTALHASKIRFIDYLSKEPILLECPLPKDMNVTLIKLRQYSSIQKRPI